MKRPVFVALVFALGGPAACLSLKGDDRLAALDGGPEAGDTDAGADTQRGPTTDGASYDADGAFDGDAPEASPAWPPPNPTWLTAPGSCAMSVASGWIVGCAVQAPNNYGILEWIDADGGGSFVPDNGSWASSISVDLKGNPWVVNNVGQIYKWNVNSFDAFGGSSFVASSVASGSNDSETWALRLSDSAACNWADTGSGPGWNCVSTPAGASKIAVFSSPTGSCSDHVPWVLTADNTVYEYLRHACEPGVFAPVQPGFDITTDFILGMDGNVYAWNAEAMVFNQYVAAPWGTRTRIGGWAHGLFAASLDTREVQMICQVSPTGCR